MNAATAFLAAPLKTLRGLPYVAWIILYCALTWGIFGALLGAVTPNLRAQMGVSFQQMGWLMAIWSAGGAVGSLLGGAIAKRFPPRRLLRAYTAAVVVALAGVLLAPSFGWLAFFMVTIATFETALFTVGHGLLAELSDEPEQRARIISLVDVGYSLGTMFSPLMAAAVLAANPNWRGPYVVFGFMALVMLLMTLQRRYLRSVAFRSDHAHAEATGQVHQPLDYGGLLRQPVVRWVLFAGVCSGLCEWGQYFWFVSFATEALGESDQVARMALGFLMAGMVTGRVWQAFVHSRWSMEQKIQGLGALAALAITGVWLSPADAPFVWLALCNYLTGLGVSVGFPILLGIALRGFPQEAPRLSALLMISFTVGAQIAALLMGELAEHFGLRAAYAVLVAAALSFFGAAWVLARQRR
ncbi:MFS transporter [Hydrogenophaga pseudoflava]|uniref:Putative transporter n=1 Tax=Hydrogenophaga pseudoflava TaxID=47421 RepID=A0A4P6WYB2_HYDPS|nr:MFS transporter [Hydrogenophaga pseudoflava]QBM26274.1 putative transporter [Hydrogenophaga pseudoflava]